MVLAMLGCPGLPPSSNAAVSKEHIVRGRADAKGVQFGRKPKLTPHQQREARKRVAAGKPQRSVVRNGGVLDDIFSLDIASRIPKDCRVAIGLLWSHAAQQPASPAKCFASEIPFESRTRRN